MKHPHATTPAPRALGSVHRDEVLPMQELGRRMGWGVEMLAAVQKMGLKTALVGRRKYVVGSEVYRFIEQQAEQGGRADAE